MNPYQYRHIPEHLAERLWKVRVVIHNRRARAYGCAGTLCVQDCLDVLEAHQNCCALCGSDEYLQVDHIVPLCDGGENAKINLRPLCRDCHRDKCDFERMGLMRRRAIYGDTNPFAPQKGV